MELNTFCTRAETDTRNLSLHLKVRVVEILGCSEAMWEWVREFQIRELEKERKRKERAALAAKNIGVGGGRVAYYHRDRARNRGKEKADNGQPPMPQKTIVESPTLAPRSPVEPKPFTFKTSREPLSLITKTSGEKPAPAPKVKAKRVGGGRVSYFHQPAQGAGSRARANSGGADLRARAPPRSPTIDTASKGTPSIYSATSNESGRRDDSFDHMEKGVRQELLHMTRQRFDEVLAWFQFDMNDSIGLTRSMIARTHCEPYPTEPTEQRKMFDEACQKLADHLQQHPKLPSPLVQSPGCGSSVGSPTCIRQGEEELCCLPPLLSLVHPSKRLCRTIRVWVAWKP